MRKVRSKEEEKEKIGLSPHQLGNLRRFNPIGGGGVFKGEGLWGR